jgi:hypothetical protein
MPDMRDDGAEETIAHVIDRALYRHPSEMYPPSRERENRPFDYVRMSRILAAVDAAQFLAANFTSARNLIDREPLLRDACQSVAITGEVLEFGVMEGRTLKILSEEFPEQEVHGFDSFEGLPEDWIHDNPAGTFSTGGALPKDLPGNARLHVGMFTETIAAFREESDRPIALLHIDSDIYSSARTVLFSLADRLRVGSIVVFDEFLNYPGWRSHEYKAFMEFTEAWSVKFRYLSFSSSYLSVAVHIDGISTRGLR